MSCTANRTVWTHERIPTSVKAILLLVLAAVALVVINAFYCRLHGSLYGAPPPSASTAWAWAVHVSVAWIAVAAAVISSSTLRLRLTSRASPVFFTTVATATIVSEWALGLAGHTFGLFDNARSLGEVAYERAPLAAAGAALIGIACKGMWWQRSLTALESPSTRARPATLQVLTGAGTCTVALAEVERFSAAENYVQVHHVTGRVYLLRMTMERLEQTLGSHEFIRVHRSTILNRSKIVERRRGGVLLLASGCTVRVGRTYRGRVGL